MKSTMFDFDDVSLSPGDRVTVDLVAFGYPPDTMVAAAIADDFQTATLSDEDVAYYELPQRWIALSPDRIRGIVYAIAPRVPDVGRKD